MRRPLFLLLPVLGAAALLACSSEPLLPPGGEGGEGGEGGAFTGSGSPAASVGSAATSGGTGGASSTSSASASSGGEGGGTSSASASTASAGGGGSGTGGSGTGGSGTGGSGTGGSGGGAACPGGLVVNELVPDPAGADEGNEWVELFNGSCEKVLLAGWKLEAGTSTFGPRFTFPEGASLEIGAYLVVGGKDVAFADFNATGSLNLGNASNADAVRLVDGSGSAVDTVVYGKENSDGWVDDTGAAATSLAPKPTSTQSLARIPNGSDTDASAVDFVATHALTPKAENATK